MPDKPWHSIAIGQCLASSFSGEWGTDAPTPNAFVLRATDIDNAGHIVSRGATRHISRRKLTDKSLRVGDILLEGSGGSPDQPVGRVAYFSGFEASHTCICSNFFRTLRADPQVVDSRFLFWKLMWFYRQPELRNLQQQTTGIINLKFDEYKSAKICIPVDVSEQAHLATVLDDLDLNNSRVEMTIDKLKQVKEGLLHDLLTRGIDSNGELRPAHQHEPPMYHASSVGLLPDTWSPIGLASMARPERSVIMTGPFGSSLKGEHWRDSGRPVVTIGSLGIGEFLEEELLFVEEPTARRLADYELVNGDIVFSRVADVGRSVVVKPEEQGWIMSSNLMRISIDVKVCDPQFLQFLLAHDERVRKQIRTTVNSAGRDVANSATLMALRFPMPLLNEQIEIVKRVQSLSARIHEETRLLHKVRATTTGLTDDLLTGRVRVTSLLDK